MHWTFTGIRQGAALGARASFSLVMFVATCCASARAQVAPVPNSGCHDGSAIGTPLYVIDDQQPVLGNLTFAIGNVCRPGANAAFFTAGPCQTAPLTDWPLTDPCFSNWATLPPSCGWAWTPTNLQFLSGDLARQGGKVTMPYPIPSVAALVGVTQCFQFVCVDLAAVDPCISVSAGISVTIKIC